MLSILSCIHTPLPLLFFLVLMEFKLLTIAIFFFWMQIAINRQDIREKSPEIL